MKTKHILFLIASFYSLSAFGNTLSQEVTGSLNLPEPLAKKIILNGRLAVPGKHAFRTTVRLKITRSDRSTGICSGVIISSQYILTAGHCFPENGMRAQVQFGLGGESGFIERTALSYRSYWKGSKTRGMQTSEETIWKDGKLSPDRKLQENFYRNIQKRKDFAVNYKNEPELHDIALIKIKDTPYGFDKIEIFRGPVVFNQDVYQAGYGVHSEIKKENDHRLRVSEQKVIGYVKAPRTDLIGWQLYSPEGKNNCFGDSGGPFFIWNKASKKWELLGISVVTSNLCANSSLAVNPLNSLIKVLVEKWAEEMNSEISL